MKPDPVVYKLYDLVCMNSAKNMIVLILFYFLFDLFAVHHPKPIRIEYIKKMLNKQFIQLP